MRHLIRILAALLVFRSWYSLAGPLAAALVTAGVISAWMCLYAVPAYLQERRPRSTYLMAGGTRAGWRRHRRDVRHAAREARIDASVHRDIAKYRQEHPALLVPAATCQHRRVETWPPGSRLKEKCLDCGTAVMSCRHPAAVPVDGTGLDPERLAWLCPDCDRQLPADWVPMPLTAAAEVVSRPAGYAGDVCDEPGCPHCASGVRHGTGTANTTHWNGSATASAVHGGSGGTGSSNTIDEVNERVAAHFGVPPAQVVTERETLTAEVEAARLAAIEQTNRLAAALNDVYEGLARNSRWLR